MYEKDWSFERHLLNDRKTLSLTWVNDDELVPLIEYLYKNNYRYSVRKNNKTLYPRYKVTIKSRGHIERLYEAYKFYDQLWNEQLRENSKKWRMEHGL